MWKPAFKLRLSVTYRVTQHVAKSVRIETHPLQEAQMSRADMPTWRPDTNTSSSEIGDGTVSRVLTLSPDTNTTSLDFELPDLKFKKSSRMAKRWVAFLCRINGDLLVVVYKLPTVIISRRNDQYFKASELLATSVTGVKRPRAITDNDQDMDAAGPSNVEPDVITPDYVEQFVTSAYEEKQFQRGLDSADLEWLCTKAGVVPGVSVVPKHVYDEFKIWFKKTVKALKHTQEVWDAS